MDMSKIVLKFKWKDKTTRTAKTTQRQKQTKKPTGKYYSTQFYNLCSYNNQDCSISRGTDTSIEQNRKFSTANLFLTKVQK
jgi:hypothetical protein